MLETNTNLWVMAWLMSLSAAALIGCGGAGAAQDDKPTHATTPAAMDA
jgi:hypothetical protein